MRVSAFRSLPFLILLSALAASGRAVAAPLRIALGATGVSVSGVTLKGKAVVFGITREVAADDVTTIQPHLDVLSDDDGDGAISEDLGQQARARCSTPTATYRAPGRTAPRSTRRRPSWRTR